jgi:hypothetical protein
MAATSSLASYGNALKILHDPKRLVETFANTDPLLGLMNAKGNQFTAPTQWVTIKSGRNNGRSANYANAVANVGSSTFGKFEIPKTDNYGYGSISGYLIRATKGKEGASAIVDALKEEVDMSYESLAEDMALKLWGNGSGARGIITGLAAGVITLSNPDNTHNFGLGQVLVFAAAETGALRGAPSTATVTAIDSSAGTITISPAAPAAVVANDYIFTQGDAANGSALVSMMGIPAYNPITAPSATPFLGVDRSVNPTAFAGHRRDGSLSPTYEIAIRSLVTQMHNARAPRRLSYMGFVHTDDLDNLAHEQRAKENYVRVQSNSAKVGYDAITIMTQFGAIPIMASYNVPRGRCWVLPPEVVKVLHVGGDMMKLMNEDGQTLRQVPGQDAFAFSHVAHANLSVEVPMAVGNTSLPT